MITLNHPAARCRSYKMPSFDANCPREDANALVIVPGPYPLRRCCDTGSLGFVLFELAVECLASNAEQSRGLRFVASRD